MRAKRWLTVIFICLGIFIVLALIKFFQIRAAIEFGESFPEPSEAVEYHAVSFSNWQPSIEVIGELMAPQEVVLRTETAGVIAKVGFLPGSTVNQGDILLQLDVSEEQARLAALEPQLQLAQKDYKRLSGIKSQAVSQQLIDQAQSRLGVARGEVTAIKEAIINKTVLAPFDGATGLHDFEVGEYLAADTLVTRLVGEGDELWVDFRLPQQFGKVAPNEQVKVTAESLFDGEIIGVVSVVEPAFSRETRSLGVRAIISNQAQKITPGSLVNVSAPTGVIRDVIRLPSTAVRQDAFGSFVFVLQQDSSKKWRAASARVKELARQGFDSFIEPSLRPGDQVATVGAFKLRDGILVQLVEPAPEDQITDPLELNDKAQEGGLVSNQGQSRLNEAEESAIGDQAVPDLSADEQASDLTLADDVKIGAEVQNEADLKPSPEGVPSE